MRTRLTGVTILAVLMLPLFVYAVCGRPARAQNDTPSWNKNVSKPPAKSTPKPRPAPRRKPTPRPTPSAGAPLSVQYRVLKVNENNSQVEVNPVTIFNRGDHLRFAVKADENVYLFVIHQKSAGQSGTIYLPDTGINNGQNSLVKDQEFVISAACRPGAPAYNCSYVVDGGSGQEVFTLIFSRSPTIKLLDSGVGADGGINPQALDAYVNGLNQNLDQSTRGDTVFARRFRNLNTPADGQVVVRLLLNKKG